MANFEFIDDPAFDGKDVGSVVELLPEGYPHPVLFLADQSAVSEEGFPCVVLDLVGGERKTFRALARMLASIENNLSIANMGFEEFEAAAAVDGVFRGFE